MSRSRSRNRKKGNARSRNRGGGRPQRDRGAGFWGDPQRLPEANSDIRITDDPSAVVRSLGQPPLPGREQVAEHYFQVVYDRAVMIAGALGAAGGMIEPEELQEEFED